MRRGPTRLSTQPRPPTLAEAAKANMPTQRLIRILIEAQLAERATKAKGKAPRKPSRRSALRKVRGLRSGRPGIRQAPPAPFSYTGEERARRRGCAMLRRPWKEPGECASQS